MQRKINIILHKKNIFKFKYAYLFVIFLIIYNIMKRRVFFEREKNPEKLNNYV